MKRILVVANETVAGKALIDAVKRHEEGVEADGRVMDPDPYSAIMDALGEEEYDEIIISTHPETRSGWLRQGLVDRVQRAARRPVEHVVVDLDAEREDVKRTLVVANETVKSRPLLET